MPAVIGQRVKPMKGRVYQILGISGAVPGCLARRLARMQEKPRIYISPVRRPAA